MHEELHYDATSTAAASTVVVHGAGVVVRTWCSRRARHLTTGATGLLLLHRLSIYDDAPKSVLTDLVELPNLPDEIGKRLVDVDALLSGGLDEFAVEVLGEVAALCVRNQKAIWPT